MRVVPERFNLRTLCLWAVAISLLAIPCYSQFFPKSSLDSRGDDFKAEWYSAQLKALNEPSLFALTKVNDAESYRFLWLRTFHHPVAIRLDRQVDGTWTLTTKVGSGAGGYKPGQLVTDKSRKLTAQEIQAFLAKVQGDQFWSAPNPVNDQAGTDGSQWIIEGAKAGKYHVVDRWMPKNGPARDLGMFLAFDLAKLSIPNGEIY